MVSLSHVGTARHPDDERGLAPAGTVEAERRRAWIRVLTFSVGTLSFVTGTLGASHEGASRHLRLVVLAAGWAYTIGFFVRPPHRRLASRHASYFTQLVDALLCFAWIAVTGGLDSPWSVTPYVVVASIAQRFSPRGTLHAALFHCAGLVGVGFACHQLPSRFDEMAIRAFLLLVIPLGAKVGARERGRFLASRLRILDLTQEVAQVGTWEWDVEQNIVTWSPQLHRTFGKPLEHRPTFESFVEAIHPDDRAHVQNVIQTALVTHEGFRMDHRIVLPDGTVRWLHCRGRVNVDVAGRATELVGSAEDVTDQQRVQEQLRFTEKLAAIGTLASGIAHEINTPLAYLGNNLEFIERAIAMSERVKDGRLVESVAAARHASARVSEIVHGLKTFSAGQDDVRRALELSRVLDMALTMVAHEIGQRARLVKDYEKTPFVFANESRLSQVFVNLLVNAAQAIETGARDDNAIAVSLSTDEQGWASARVTDTGSGIAPENLKRIFDPFFTTKETGVGTGLGLSICHGIVRDLGGEIFVESEIGIGTTFTVLLPPAPQVEVEAMPEPPAVRPLSVRPVLQEEVPPDAEPRGRVLVVDDEPRYGASLRMVLEGDHDVELAGDGEAALARCKAANVPDLILCDLMMPGMSGIELHEALVREHPALVDRVVFLTGGATTDAARAFLARPEVRYLSKLTEPDALRKLAAEMMRKRIADKSTIEVD